MKRPLTLAIYHAVDSTPEEVTRRVLDLFRKEVDGVLENYYGLVRVNPEDGTYSVHDERSDLSDPDDLLRRVAPDGNATFSCDLNLDFGPRRSDAWSSGTPRAGEKTTLLLAIEPVMTKLIEKRSRPACPSSCS